MGRVPSLHCPDGSDAVTRIKERGRRAKVSEMGDMSTGHSGTLQTEGLKTRERSWKRQ